MIVVYDCYMQSKALSLFLPLKDGWNNAKKQSQNGVEFINKKKSIQKKSAVIVSGFM